MRHVKNDIFPNNKKHTNFEEVLIFLEELFFFLEDL